MPVFRCFIRGENFPGKLVGQVAPIGFYTTRFVDAETPEQAEMLAVGLLRVDEDLDVAPEHRTPDAKVYFEKIEEVPAEMERKPNKGFSFFTMDD